jgi:RsiW-degrading membrane proteinase PrsW (M82 family)
MWTLAGKFALGLVPALLYLTALVVLDSYKLVRLRTVLAALGSGCAALVLCNHLNGWLIDATGLSVPAFSRYVAPLTEEAAKAVFLVWMVRRRRIGFMVDAAIVGFAAGVGFGILENIFYLRLIPEAGVVTWILRGCGTALMP